MLSAVVGVGARGLPLPGGDSRIEVPPPAFELAPVELLPGRDEGPDVGGRMAFGGQLVDPAAGVDVEVLHDALCAAVAEDHFGLALVGEVVAGGADPDGARRRRRGRGRRAAGVVALEIFGENDRSGVIPDDDVVDQRPRLGTVAVGHENVEPVDRRDIGAEVPGGPSDSVYPCLHLPSGGVQLNLERVLGVNGVGCDVPVGAADVIVLAPAGLPAVEADVGRGVRSVPDGDGDASAGARRLDLHFHRDLGSRNRREVVLGAVVRGVVVPDHVKEGRSA